MLHKSLVLHRWAALQVVRSDYLKTLLHTSNSYIIAGLAADLAADRVRYKKGLICN